MIFPNLQKHNENCIFPFDVFNFKEILNTFSNALNYNQPMIFSSFYSRPPDECISYVTLIAKILSKEQNIDFTDAKRKVLDALAETVIQEEGLELP